jgi:hypothetical protein
LPDRSGITTRTKNSDIGQSLRFILEIKYANNEDKMLKDLNRTLGKIKQTKEVKKFKLVKGKRKVVKTKKKVKFSLTKKDFKSWLDTGKVVARKGGLKFKKGVTFSKLPDKQFKTLINFVNRNLKKKTLGYRSHYQFAFDIKRADQDTPEMCFIFGAAKYAHEKQVLKPSVIRSVIGQSLMKISNPGLVASRTKRGKKIIKIGPIRPFKEGYTFRWKIVPVEAFRTLYSLIKKAKNIRPNGDGNNAGYYVMPVLVDGQIINYAFKGMHTIFYCYKKPDGKYKCFDYATFEIGDFDNQIPSV